MLMLAETMAARGEWETYSTVLDEADDALVLVGLDEVWERQGGPR